MEQYIKNCVQSKQHFREFKVQVKTNVSNRQSFQPIWEPEKWKDVRFETNCYAYALDIPIKTQFHSDYWVGRYSAENSRQFTDTEYNSTRELVEAFLNDLYELGIEVSSYRPNEISQKGSYNIGLLYERVPDDFHFVRQDVDGSWSHKLGFVHMPEKITLEKLEDCYTVVSYFNLKRRMI